MSKAYEPLEPHGLFPQAPTPHQLRVKHFREEAERQRQQEAEADARTLAILFGPRTERTER
jgi:hypothetical protein